MSSQEALQCEESVKADLQAQKQRKTMTIQDFLKSLSKCRQALSRALAKSPQEKGPPPLVETFQSGAASNDYSVKHATYPCSVKDPTKVPPVDRLRSVRFISRKTSARADVVKLPAPRTPAVIRTYARSEKRAREALEDRQHSGSSIFSTQSFRQHALPAPDDTPFGTLAASTRPAVAEGQRRPPNSPSPAATPLSSPGSSRRNNRQLSSTVQHATDDVDSESPKTRKRKRRAPIGKLPLVSDQPVSTSSEYKMGVSLLKVSILTKIY